MGQVGPWGVFLRSLQTLLPRFYRGLPTSSVRRCAGRLPGPEGVEDPRENEEVPQSPITALRRRRSLFVLTRDWTFGGSGSGNVGGTEEGSPCQSLFVHVSPSRWTGLSVSFLLQLHPKLGSRWTQDSDLNTECVLSEGDSFNSFESLGSEVSTSLTSGCP